MNKNKLKSEGSETKRGDEDENKKVLKGRLEKIKSVLSVLTIEEMMVIQGVAVNMAKIPQEQMLLYKICREEKFNTTDEYCRDFESHEGTQLYTDIESEVVSFNTIITYSEHLIPILLAFYIGSWSDHFGRKKFLAMCMIGKILQATANLLNAIYLSSWNRWVWLATVMPPQSLTGGFLTFVMMVYSFISDNSTPRERTLRLGFLSFTWRLSNPIATALGGLLFQQGGYICVLSSSLLLFVIASIIGLIRLWNFKEHIGSKNKHSFGYFLHPRHVTESFRVVFKKRSDHKRTYLILSMLIMLSGMFGEMGEENFQFMYTKRLFKWTAVDYSWYKTIKEGLASLFMIVFMPVFHRLRVVDNTIILFAAGCAFSAVMLRGVTNGLWWIFYVSAVVEAPLALFSPPIRGQMTRCVKPEELGKAFAMLASVESLVPMLSSTMFTNLYNAVIENGYYIGLCCFVAAGFHIVGLIIVLYIMLSLRCGEVPLEDEDSISKRSSNLHPDFMKRRAGEVYTLSYKQSTQM